MRALPVLLFVAAAWGQESFEDLFNRGYDHFRDQRFSDAEPLLRRAADLNRRDFNTLYLLGVVRQKLGQPDAALLTWRDALAVQPANVRLMQVMSVEYSKGRYFAEAAEIARRALENRRDDPNIYFLAIKAYQDAGDDTEASKIAELAVQRFPDSARANFELAYHLQKQGKIAEAEAGLKKSMAADPRYEEPFFFYGNLLVNQERNEQAIPYLEQAIANRGGYVPARVALARALMNLKKWPEAVAALERTIAMDPTHPQPHLLLSQIYFRLGDEDKARTEKQISLRLRRENPTILEAAQARPFGTR